MAKDNAQSSFQRGVMSLLILSLLDQEDMYGYQIVQEIAARSGGTIVTQEGSLYPVLYKLQDQGMISGEKVLVGKRMTRVYYHLEEPGHRRLQELVHEYQVMTRGVFQIIQRGNAASRARHRMPNGILCEAGQTAASRPRRHCAAPAGFFIKQSKKISTYFDFFEKTCPFSDSDVI